MTASLDVVELLLEGDASRALLAVDAVALGTVAQPQGPRDDTLDRRLERDMRPAMDAPRKLDDVLFSVAFE